MSRGRARANRPHARSLADLEEHLRHQYSYLKRSARAYDDGHTEEAVRLAAVVRVLCHDGEGHGLLRQLRNLRKRLRFVDTSSNLQAPPGAIAVNFGLCGLRMDFDRTVTRPRPYLDDLPEDRVNPPAQFGHWWSTPFLDLGLSKLTGGPSFLYSRKHIVLGLANHDGGAHVDSAVSDEHQALIDYDGVAQFVVNGQRGTIGRNEIARAWMRQIAHEVQRTLERDFRSSSILEGRPSGLT